MCNFPEADFKELTKWILEIYGKFEIQGNDFERLYEFMTHDKKNESGRINFTLLPKIGEIEINQNCDKELIYAALHFYKEL